MKSKLSTSLPEQSVRPMVSRCCWKSGLCEVSIPSLLVSWLVHYPGFDHVCRSSQNSCHQPGAGTANSNRYLRKKPRCIMTISASWFQFLEYRYIKTVIVKSWVITHNINLVWEDCQYCSCSHVLPVPAALTSVCSFESGMKDPQ